MQAKKSHLIPELKVLEFLVGIRLAVWFGNPDDRGARGECWSWVDDVTRRLIEQVDCPVIGLPGDDEKVNALLRVRRLLDSRILVGHPVKHPWLGRERVGRDIRAHAAEDDFCHLKFVCRSRQCTNARDRENECEKRISKPESRIANRESQRTRPVADFRTTV